MKKLIFGLFFAILCIGCSLSPSYLEGTHLQLGAYVPTQNNSYGVELVQYTSGCIIKTKTNETFSVDRQFSSTNSYLWGMVHTVESSRTKVNIKEDN